MCDKNMLLVKTIEKFPCLYNYNLSDYSKKDVTDKIWNEVSNETKLSVGECKEKWKNLRYGFIRSLRPNPDGSSKRKYYLHDEMEFVLPYVKLLTSKQANKTDVHPEDETDEDNNDHENENEQQLQQQCFDIEFNHASIESAKRMRICDPLTKYVTQRTTNTYERYDDTRRMFLLSLLPEVAELTESQMKVFRRKVLSLLDDIVDGPNQYDSGIIQWQQEQQRSKQLSHNDVIKSEHL